MSRAAKKKSLMKRNERTSDEFLPTITAIFRLSRWFGIPVYGDKRFLLLTVMILSMMVIIEIMAIIKFIRAQVSKEKKFDDDRGVTARLSGAIFYLNTILSLLISWRFIRTWKQVLSRSWLLTEMNTGLCIKPEKNIKMRVIFVSCFVIFCGCVEHLLSMMAAAGLNCPISEYITCYVLSSHRFMIHKHEYNKWVEIMIFTMSNIATILWNFQDLIVILTSMGLASRYHRLNLFVQEFITLQKHAKHSNQYRFNLLTSVQTWRKLRMAYVQQADLVRKVEQHLGVLILLCNLNNFFFICLQLFLGLRKSEGSVINRAYYLVSLGWLIFRACSVVLAAADVNLHSQMALTTICECPSSRYNVEVKRLKYQLINDEVVISGKGLFSLNRYKLLEVGAAIIKYELILLQFDK